ncbi:sigma-E processing peptidase SpoIIGA [Vallitalea okinawensis]|uniref:sigma-E processing peptidase SpoIIGA n=1 Tax=Vallitalea okinawensis TaxID=2078660 RepID=UPI000CFBE201|nr:sigma-E processing peptidase SpoIIGA [Vallitalea okinawensis]
MEIYFDVLFLINLIMDFIILWVVNAISKENSKKGRLLLGALFGAVTMCLLVFVPKELYNFIGYVLITVGMIAISFKFRNIKNFIKLWLLTYLVAVCIGGTGIALFYYTNLGSIVGNMFIFQLNNLSINLLLGSIIVSYIFIKFFVSWYGKFLLTRRKLYAMDIMINEKNIGIKGLVDTGNSLVDPLTNMPVVIVESSQFKDIIPKDLLYIISKNSDYNLELLASVAAQSDLKSRLRLIPFTSIGKNNGLLVGFKPDQIILYDTQQTKKIEDVIVAISDKNLAQDGTYNALIHPALVE